MADYNVKQISELVNVDSETVRRWIRTNKLKGTKDSKKTGFVVSESELKRFLNGIPKYSEVAAGLMAAAVPAVGVPIAVGTLLGSLVGSLLIGKGTERYYRLCPKGNFESKFINSPKASSNSAITSRN